jgi:hypothetical protein
MIREQQAPNFDKNEIMESFITAEHEDKQNQSVSVIPNSKSVVPFIARIKNELMANSHKDQDQSISSEGDNPYEYYF